MHGRLLGLYVVGGWSAPTEVRSTCKQESVERVIELFTRPLNMDADAKNGIREYWHYSFYRECLYHAGYTFLGKPLPRATLAATPDNQYRYTNPLAGTSLVLEDAVTFSADNTLDVTFDYRLLRTSFNTGTTTLFFDTYTEHQFIHTFADLPTYLDHFPASTGTIVASESRTTTSGIPYLSVTQDDGLCGNIFVTPAERIVHLYAACTEHKKIQVITDTLTFTSDTASVH